MTEIEFLTYIAKPMAMEISVAVVMGLAMGGAMMAYHVPEKLLIRMREHRMPKLALAGLLICTAAPIGLFKYIAVRAFETDGGATKYHFSWTLAVIEITIAPFAGFAAGWLALRIVERVARQCRKVLRHFGHW